MSWSHDYWRDLAEIELDALGVMRSIGRGRTKFFAKRWKQLNWQARIAAGMCQKHAAPVVPGRRCCRKCLDKARVRRRQPRLTVGAATGKKVVTAAELALPAVVATQPDRKEAARE